MKDKKAEEIIRGKIREQESNCGFLEGQATLWAVLDERLEEKPAPAGKRYYTWLAAASVVFLLALGFYLYPAHKSGHDRQTVVVKPAQINTPVVPQVVQQEEKKATAAKRQPITVHTVKKTAKLKKEIKETEMEKQDDAAADYAGRSAMPQIACAEVTAVHYPLCSQTL